MSKKYRCYVGANVPVKRRSDGVLLMGTRKFTPQELVEYKRNMYGKNYFRRLAIKQNKIKMQNPEYRKHISTLAEFTKEIYGHDFYRKMSIKNKNHLYPINYAKTHPDFYKNRGLAARHPNRNPTKRYVKNAWFYFIDDTTINGHEYKYLDHLLPGDPDFEIADAMRVIFKRRELDKEDLKNLYHKNYKRYEANRKRKRLTQTSVSDILET